MVRLHVKRGDESLFLIDATLNSSISELSRVICYMFNGRLKIFRLCNEIRELCAHGVMLPPNMQGLADEQIEELKLVDPWSDIALPSGGFSFNKDPIGRRNGRQPKLEMQKVLTDAVESVKKMVDKKLVFSDTTLNLKTVEQAIEVLKGTVAIVYPMQLPPYDVIRMELTNTEDLSGMQASKEVLEFSKAQLWFAGHHMLPDKTLADYAGRNEKCKILVKLVKFGEGIPGREPYMNDEMQRRWMLQSYRRQEELKKLEQDDDDQYSDSSWADGSSLKQQVHGLYNIKFRY